jgi:hypothetical protein
MSSHTDWHIYSKLGVIPSQSQSYITTDGQSASLFWCQAPIWHPRPIFPLLSFIIFRQFDDVGRPLWREVGSVVFSFCWASPALPSSDDSHGTHEHILLSWDSPNLEGQVPVFISPRNKVAHLYPRALGFSVMFPPQVFLFVVESGLYWQSLLQQSSPGSPSISCSL